MIILNLISTLNILTIFNQRVIYLNVWRARAFPLKNSIAVFCAMIVSRILYALPAWGGFLTADLIGIHAYLWSRRNSQIRL